jgi:virginiamycin A acetyltransferase
VRSALKSLAYGVATLLVLPNIISFHVRSGLIGRNRALEGSTQALAWLPGLLGVYLRGAFLAWVLDAFDRSASVHFGTIFSQVGARIGANVYVGPRCHLGLVRLERDVLLAAGVHVPSGTNTHGTGETSIPIRDQEGERTMVSIGEGTWVGSAAVVMADVGRHSVVAAGAVVTKSLPDFVVAGGVPARVIRNRGGSLSPSKD